MTDIQPLLEDGDVIIDATGKPYTVGPGGIFPPEVLLYAWSADHRWDTEQVNHNLNDLPLPVVVVARHGQPAEIYIEDTAGVSAAVADQPVAPGDAPASVEQG